jgi:nitroimidazol reductase NimA-like FMN-containing flavoprotein (pyridoxamine 5'-phosphate oxidase superfamily)
MGIQFTEVEERDFLTTTHTGIVTTVRGDGWPISLPVWFAYLDGAIYMRTPTRSKKVARVRNDDRACFLVEAGEAWADLHAVVWLGRLTEVSDDALRDLAAATINAKYAAFRAVRTRMPDATKQHYGPSDVTYELRPSERRITWDNRKLRMT